MSPITDAMTTTDAAAAAAEPALPPTAASSRPWLVPALALLIVLATFAVFGQTLGFEFVNWDDPVNVYQNPYYVPQVTVQSIGYFWSHAYFELYMPVTYSLWGLCALLGKGHGPAGVTPDGDILPFSPLPFHALNLLLHIGSALAAFALLLRLAPIVVPSASPNRRALAAAAGALLFALHPLQAESVGWVTGANNVISGFFALLALYAYVRHAEVGASGKRAIPWFIAATVAYALALLAKPTATSVPLVALVIDALILRRSWRRWAPVLALWVALAGAMVLVTHASSGVSQKTTLPLLGRPFIVGDALAFYLGKLFAPIRLTVDYGRHPSKVLGSWWGHITWLFPAVVGVLLWRTRARTRPVGIGLLLLIAATLPILGFVPFYLHRLTTVADRYMYLALIGPALALTALLAAMPSRSRYTRPVAAGAIALLALLGGLCGVQVGTWRDSVRQFVHTLSLNPKSATAYTNLGIVVVSGGVAEGPTLDHLLESVGLSSAEQPGEVGPGVPPERRGRLVAALHCFEAAVRAQPDHAVAHYHLGAGLMELHRVDPSLAEFREAVRLDPHLAVAWFRLGAALGQFPDAQEEAITALQHATQLEPNSADAPEAYYILGVLLGNRRQYADAEAQFAAVVQRNPGFAEAHYNLAQMREKQGRIADALPEYREAVRLAPDNAAFAAALRRAESAGKR